MARKTGSGKHLKISQRVGDLVKSQMQKDDETTASEFVCQLQEHGINLSKSTSSLSEKPWLDIPKLNLLPINSRC